MTEASTPKQLILVVDDSPEILTLLHNLLKEHYQVKVANNGEKALQICQRQPAPALILLDVMMPGMDGYAVCRQLKAAEHTRQIPILFLTGQHESHEETAGFAAGAVDYIHKPVSAQVLLARVGNHLALKAARDALSQQNEHLEREVAKRTREIQIVQDGIVQTMASLAETRDNETGNHILRTQHYVQALATQLQSHPRFAAQLDATIIALLFKSAPLHDIGKIGIPDHILLKPGKLTPEEFEHMKTHATLGYEVLSRTEHNINAELPFFRTAKEIALHHHEKWDGSGYPHGLAGDDIPMSARLMALADVYDALISPRVYKPAMSHQQARDLIVSGSGKHFDPDVVTAFLVLEEHFQAISAKHCDTATSH